MDYYISGDSITNQISTLHFFSLGYYKKYIQSFIPNNKLILDTNINEKDTLLIFITKIESLDNFYNKIIPSLNNKFILITHYGDGKAGVHDKILNHPLLIKWYGQNMSIISDKTSAIPIGLENRYWKRTDISVIKKHSNNSKESLLYLNFSLKTNPQRGKIMKNLLQKGFHKNNKLPWADYIKDLSTHKFCISPNGNGVDCHRTWEALYLGVIPIVEKSIEMSYFNDLRILFVDSYDDISIDYLNQIYIDFQHNSFNTDKLSISYWERKIKEEFNQTN
jgi:hypothetical protein